MKILVVEDDSTVGKLLLAFLKRWQIDGVLADNAESALEILQETSVDLLITDLSMPGMSGIDLLEKVRQDSRYQDLPVLMISGQADRQNIVDASRLGISGFIAKPFKAEQLRKKILLTYRAHRRSSQDAQLEEFWEERTTIFGEFSSPQIIFGEPLRSLVDLSRSENRSVAHYLCQAHMAITRANAERPDLDLGYIIEDNTTGIIAHLRKPTARRWIRLIMLSTRCNGNPVLIVRLFTINRRDETPILLVYEHGGDLADSQREGFRKLGIRMAQRSTLDADRFHSLIERHIGDSQPKTRASSADAHAPDELHRRVLNDIDAMTSLPPLPQVYEKILTLARDPNSDLKEWIRAIRVDPMTCATIFRHVNSLHYGFQGDITDIDRAIVLLGKNAVLGLVASEAVRQSFTAVQEKGFRLEEFWLHNMAVGFAAHILSLPVDPKQATPAQQKVFAALKLGEEAAKTLRQIDLPGRLELDYASENAFVSGIMHDLGKAVMVHSYAGLFPLILDELDRQEWQVGMLAAESIVAGGLTHAVAGEVLARRWGLGESLCNAILYHHKPAANQALAFLTGVADFIGLSLYPFPRGSAFPVASALESGDLTGVRAFLPAGFSSQSRLSEKELVALAGAIGPKVKFLTEKMRQSVR